MLAKEEIEEDEQFWILTGLGWPLKKIAPRFSLCNWSCLRRLLQNACSCYYMFLENLHFIAE